MGKVYRLGGANQTIYCNTRRQADSARPDGEQPMSFDVFDAAIHCRDLYQRTADLERTIIELQCLLSNLYDTADGHTRGSTHGREAANAIMQFDREAAIAMGICVR